MTFLPIAQRELRVTARRKSTFIIRGAAALLGLAIGALWLMIYAILPLAKVPAGAWMFGALSKYTLLISLLAGILLASDCLSEERREGTLGFLFLTGSRGYDVVLGKFLAVSLNAFYGLLAGFPIFAISFMAGGVTPGQFVRTCLALVNVLFFSVSLSLWVSSRSRSAARAMTVSLCLLLAVIVVCSVVLYTPFKALAALSPVEAFLRASDAQYFRLSREYWKSLAVSHLAAWMLLGLAVWHLRTFADEPSGPGRWRRFFARSPRKRAVRRARLLEVNPVIWLLDDSRRLRWIVWLLCLAGAATLLCMSANMGAPGLLLIGYAAMPFYFLLKIVFAVQACRFFSESRRTGALELLCCTPLTMRSIIKGQWTVLRQIFLLPVVVLLCAHLVAVAILATDDSLTKQLAGGMILGMLAFLWSALKLVPNSVADLFAIGWFGMWLALTLRKSNWATGLTILYVVVLPTVIFCMPALLVDTIFIVIGWARLSADFRLHAARQ